ncbi:hypothetical protein DL768_006257 [Monosporascus sp. mg162]|nr:hypothetical protein DL768_006257 [Monosporascus sp. mg162]
MSILIAKRASTLDLRLSATTAADGAHASYLAPEHGSLDRFMSFSLRAGEEVLHIRRREYSLMINISTQLDPATVASHVPHRLRRTGPVPGQAPLPAVHGSPVRDPVLDADSADPSVLGDVDGQWYVFATESNGMQVQAACTRLAGYYPLPVPAP